MIRVHIVFQSFYIILLNSSSFFNLFLFLIYFFFFKILSLFFCPWTCCLHIRCLLIILHSETLLIIDLILFLSDRFCRSRSWIYLSIAIIVKILKWSFYSAMISFFYIFIFLNLIIIYIQFNIYIFLYLIQIFLIVICNKGSLFKWCPRLWLLVLCVRLYR